MKKFHVNNQGRIYKKGGRVKQYNEEVSIFIKEILQEDPTLYLSEIKKRSDEDLNLQKELKDLNYTKKKIEKVAYYRTLDRVQNSRASFRFYIKIKFFKKCFRERMKDFHPHSFLYLDESHFESSRQGRNFSYSQKGEKALSFENKPETKRYSLICVMSAYEIFLYIIIDTTKSGVNGEIFIKF
eukprot:gene11484-4648_t